jgi:hypothetical protein
MLPKKNQPTFGLIPAVLHKYPVKQNHRLVLACPLLTYIFG